jgi:hypothetical protein
VQPDLVIFVSVLNACASAGAPEVQVCSWTDYL